MFPTRRFLKTCHQLVSSHFLAFVLFISGGVFLLVNLHYWSTYSSELRERFLSLDNLSEAYITALRKSNSDGTAFSYNEPDSINYTIPKIIHQTYKTSEVPEKWQLAHASCREQNPSYTHYLWTDDTARDFLKENYGWFLPTYDLYPYPIQRVDAIRYFILWHYGGVYIDLDIGCRRPLDPLLNATAWFPKTKPFGVSNDLMASRARHPVMLKLFSSLQHHNRAFLTGYTTVFWSTGPMFVNNILAEWFWSLKVPKTHGEGPNRALSRIRRGEPEENFLLTASDMKEYDISILPSMFYDESEFCFFKHFRGSSWHGSDVAVISWLFGRLWWIVGVVTAMGLGAYRVYHVRRKQASYEMI